MVLDERLVASYYAQADIFVSASASETFGFTVAEAMACGTPAVVVKSGAFPTVYSKIHDNMFNVDDMQSYAECCARVYANLEKQSEIARKYAVQGYSINSAIDDMLQTYQGIVNHK